MLQTAYVAVSLLQVKCSKAHIVGALNNLLYF